MKIDFTQDEIGILNALVFDGLNNKEAERWFEGMDEENKKKAKSSFFNLKSKVLAASFIAMADNVSGEKEASFE